MGRYYVGLDVGTSSTKVVVFEENSLKVTYKVAQSYPSHFDRKFGITVKASDVVDAVQHCLDSVAEVLKSQSLKKKEVYIVLDTMLHSLLFLDKSLRPIGNIIPWLNELGTDVVIDVLRDEVLSKELHGRTGCPVAPTYPFYKLIWFSKNENELLQSVSKVGSIKDYLVYILTGSHVVDKSIASGTGCYDIRSNIWDDDLLRSFVGLNSSLFPDVVSGGTILDSSSFVKNIFDEKLFDVKVVVGTSDGAASSMGTTFGDSNLITISMGTSAAIRRVLNNIPNPEQMRGFGPWCYVFDDGSYIVGSATNNCGNVINWWKNSYLRSDNYTMYEQIIKHILFEKEDATKTLEQYVLFKPTVFGMRSTRWLPYQRAEFYNITPQSSIDKMTRAVIEGLMFKFKRAVDAVEEVTEKSAGKPYGFVASGGLLKISGFGTLLTTILNRKVFYRSNRYDAALGAVLFALKHVNKQAFQEFVNLNKKLKNISASLEHIGLYEKVYHLWLEKMQGVEASIINKFFLKGGNN